MKNGHPSVHSTVDELLTIKLNNLTIQRDRLNMEIKRIEQAMGAKPKPLSELKKPKKIKLSVKLVRNAVISFGQKKKDYFTLNEVKRQCFPNEFSALTVETRKEMTSAFQAVVTQLKKKGMALDKEHPGGNGTEKLYFIKEEAYGLIKE